MLNGIAPVLIFGFTRIFGRNTSVGVNIPLLSEEETMIPLVPIPVYLDADQTGIHIMSISKSIDIRTDVDALPDGSKPTTTQKPLNSVIRIEAKANIDSIGLNILLAMADIIFTKTTSREYSVTFVSGSMNAFGALLESFSAVQSSQNDVYDITIQLSNAPSAGTAEQTSSVTIPRTDGATLSAANVA